MDITIMPGTYVVAVSGGVDSMVLLDLLTKKPGLKLVVSHYDHGMRADSEQDRLFVHKACERYGLPFVFDEGHLGEQASEAKAREARYKFLRKVRKATVADAIITAHHQDDVIETAIINILRGTKRRGMTSLHAYTDVIRPLLQFSKNDILAYASKHELRWHEDATNQDTRYLRNYVRHKILPKFSNEDRDKFLGHIDNLAKLNADIDSALINHLHIHPASNALDRHWFIMLPHDVAREVLAGWLRNQGISNYDTKLLEKLLVGAKTLKPGKQMSVNKTQKIRVLNDKLAL